MRSISRDHIVESGLSRQSALNDRYFEKESTRSRSLDNLLSPVSETFKNHCIAGIRIYYLSEVNLFVTPTLQPERMKKNNEKNKTGESFY